MNPTTLRTHTQFFTMKQVFLKLKTDKFILISAHEDGKTNLT